MCVIPLLNSTLQDRPDHNPGASAETEMFAAWRLKKDHEIWHAAVVDVGVGGGDRSAGCTAPLPRIRSEVIRHVLVDSFWVDADCR